MFNCLTSNIVDLTDVTTELCSITVPIWCNTDCVFKNMKQLVLLESKLITETKFFTVLPHWPILYKLHSQHCYCKLEFISLGLQLTLN